MLKVNQVSGGYLSQRIIRDITFNIDTGEIVGLVGLNGAGKSTTLRHITGSLKPMSGNISINDREWYSEREKLSLIPDQPKLYPNLTVREHFEFLKLVYQIDNDDYLKQLIKRYTLHEHMNKYPYALSKGTQQKISIISAMITNPTFLIVDEPFMGLDPLGLKCFLEDLNKFKENGKGIILSTHMLNIAEKLCDRVIVMHKGVQKFYNGTPYLSADLFKNTTLDELFFSMIEDA
ncbi:ABC transporter ATP-binding protein [Bacillus sp. JCM 19041]|uniref:ABC transporter ATP-binding protein n=1 Tax=Bacillus sp. JCM 19041 TaxID=1460637 RepID=UPI0006D25ADD